MKSKEAITKLQAVILIAVLIVAIACVYYYYFILPRAAPPELRIGAAVSQTGPYGPTGSGVLEGYLLWEEDVNNRGGILGRRVKLIVYDDKSDPTTTKSLYEKLITVDKVDLLLGPYASACALAMIPLAEQYKMVVLHPINTAITLYNQGYEYQFLVCTAGIAGLNLMTPVFELLASLPEGIRPKTVGIVNTADTFPRSVEKGAENDIKKFGFTLIFKEEVEKGATDVSAVITKLKVANPDIVLFAGYVPEETLLIKTCYELGFKPKGIIAVDAMLLWPDSVKLLGPLFDYVIGSTRYSIDYPFAINKKFVEMYRKKFGKDPTIHPAVGYAAGILLEEAIKKAGKIDNEAIRAALMDLQVELPFGIWQIDKDLAKAGIKYVPKSFQIVSQIVNGKPVHVWPPQYASGQLIYPIPPK